MFTAAAVIPFLLGATVVVTLGILLHWQYQRWPPYQWKQRLEGRVADLRRRRDRLLQPADALTGQADRLRADLFRHHLRSIPVERLAEFPGIGSGTVDRVRGHAGATLAAVADFAFETIKGIGPSKAGELRGAVESLLREAESRFQAGGCP